MIKRLDVSDGEDGGSAKWCKSVQKGRKRQKVTMDFVGRDAVMYFYGVNG